MANEPTKLVRFRALCNVSLRPGVDELPTEFSADERPYGTPTHVLTFGEEWHFERTEADLQRLIKAKAIVVLPASTVTPSNNEEN